MSGNTYKDEKTSYFKVSNDSFTNRSLGGLEAKNKTKFNRNKHLFHGEEMKKHRGGETTLPIIKMDKNKQNKN